MAMTPDTPELPRWSQRGPEWERFYSAVGGAVPSDDEGTYVDWYDGYQITYDGIDAIVAAVRAAGFEIVGLP